jgi:hypothetical protein
MADQGPHGRGDPVTDTTDNGLENALRYAVDLAVPTPDAPDQPTHTEELLTDPLARALAARLNR